MPWIEQIPIQRHMTISELELRIKTLEKDTKILKRLYFVKYRYQGTSVEESAQRIGITRNEGYVWQRRWNDNGYDGIIPHYSGGRPMKLTLAELAQLKDQLDQKSAWTTDEVRLLIHEKFKVEYTLKQIRIILKKLNMKYGKPFTFDYRRPDDAESILKKPS